MPLLQPNLYFEERLLDRAAALRRFSDVRAATCRLTAPLSPEDAAIQTMPDVSPAKWHLAHSTWFFEAFILKPLVAGYREVDPDYHYLFNSYYEAQGPRHPRPQRGLITRPSLAEIMEYRAEVDCAMAALIESGANQGADDHAWAGIAPLIDLGCQHEEQHQELILTDIKHVLFSNPLRPAYTKAMPKEVRQAAELSWASFEEGIREIGHAGGSFAYDNEGPRHKQYVQGFALASRPATNGEYLEFMEDGGYARPEFWLSDGWATVQAQGWTRPLYWEQAPEGWQVFTLRGRHAMNSAEPVAHLSYFEADAFARWSGARLPREAELEIALGAHGDPDIANDAGRGALNPMAADGPDIVGGAGLAQLYGDVWEWTQSSYAAYPGYAPAPGAVGEYNGKFMCNQYVLKGGSCFTPPGHIRATYRNFFPADARWQMTGVRLARDI